MKVIFDFDDVLFEAKKFKERMFSILESKGYSSASQVYAQMRLSLAPFSPHEFLKNIDSSLTDEQEGSLYEEIMESCSDLANDEVVRIARALGKDNCYILTNGDEAFQMDKIRRSIGEDLAAKIIVVSGGKREALRLLCKRHENEDIIFVDDKLMFLNDIHPEDCSNLKTVLFNENGITNLLAEIKDSLVEEEKRELHQSPSQEVLARIRIAENDGGGHSPFEPPHIPPAPFGLH